jgi:hypothetical protein
MQHCGRGALVRPGPKIDLRGARQGETWKTLCGQALAEHLGPRQDVERSCPGFQGKPCVGGQRVGAAAMLRGRTHRGGRPSPRLLPSFLLMFECSPTTESREHRTQRTQRDSNGTGIRHKTGTRDWTGESNETREREQHWTSGSGQLDLDTVRRLETVK